MVVPVVGSDSKVEPDGFGVQLSMAELQLDNATGIVLTTPTTATTVADAANGWTISKVAGNFVNGTHVVATTGIFTLPKTADYEVSWALSGITVVNGQVLTCEVYLGATGAGLGTASKGKCVATQLTAAPCVLTGSVVIPSSTGTIGQFLTLKIIASTGNFTCKQGYLRVMEV